MIDISKEFRTLYERKKIWHEALSISAPKIDSTPPFTTVMKKKVTNKKKSKHPSKARHLSLDQKEESSHISIKVRSSSEQNNKGASITNEELNGTDKDFCDNEDKEVSILLKKVNLARYFTRRSRLIQENEEAPEIRQKNKFQADNEDSHKLDEKKNNSVAAKSIARGVKIKVSQKCTKEDEENDNGNKPSNPLKRLPIQDLGVRVTRRLKPIEREENSNIKQSQLLLPAGVLTPYKQNSDSSRVKELLKDP